ncbi:MAG: non-canonical purine NTP diphosphatase [Breznakibacter sp.]
MELVFATHNQHKLEELKKLMPSTIKLLSLNDIGEYEEIPETGNTLTHNASLKAWHVFNKFGKNCFADDTGLEVEALNNEPGVYSARYAGEEKNPEKNVAKLLSKLEGKISRKACFRTVISLIIDGREYLFEGSVEGEIETEPKGGKGFGYDPVFRPLGFGQTFAQIDITLKNKISHRGRAVEKLMSFLAQDFK